ncbi:hypothetical protein [Arthrobacter sp. 24S4-2]|uniref:hypothetical protein n=1 Tax=Arthrobacter sp. 24S4-2 TaxID=2575374 RepID=UPI0034A0B80D
MHNDRERPLGPVHSDAARPDLPQRESLHDWRYESDPEPHMGGHRVAHARGEVLSVLEPGPATPLFQAFFKAAQESGFPPTDHVNGCPERGIEPLDEDLEPQRVS